MQTVARMREGTGEKYFIASEDLLQHTAHKDEFFALVRRADAERALAAAQGGIGELEARTRTIGGHSASTVTIACFNVVGFINASGVARLGPEVRQRHQGRDVVDSSRDRTTVRAHRR